MLDILRMKLEVGGHYFEPQADGQFKVTTVSQCSLGGSVPKSLAKKLLAANLPKFLTAFKSAVADATLI